MIVVFSHTFLCRTFRFGVRVHRSLQAALLFVAGPWSWESAAAGFGGTDTPSWLTPYRHVTQEVFLFDHICLFCRLWTQWHRTKNVWATLQSPWFCPTFCCCCTRFLPVRNYTKTSICFLSFDSCHKALITILIDYSYPGFNQIKKCNHLTTEIKNLKL